MPSEYLSELEELILLAVAACYPEAYAYALKKEIKAQAKRGLSLATIHTVLYRLEGRGLVRSEMGGRTQKRGGRSKRLYVMTTSGIRMLKETRAAREALWRRAKPFPGLL